MLTLLDPLYLAGIKTYNNDKLRQMQRSEKTSAFFMNNLKHPMAALPIERRMVNAATMLVEQYYNFHGFPEKYSRALNSESLLLKNFLHMKPIKVKKSTHSLIILNSSGGIQFLTRNIIGLTSHQHHLIGRD